MELVISHFEGCSGNFIGHLYANKELNSLSRFRVDMGKYSHIMAFEGRERWHDDLKACKDHTILVSHQFNKELIYTAFPEAKHIAIWPYTNQMNVLWNICYKKLSPSNINNIDYHFINLKEWHSKLQSCAPAYQCFDYGKLSDFKYVESMLGVTLDDNQRRFFDEYWSAQLGQNLTWPIKALSIPEIIHWYNLENNINDWNVALVLYTFEAVNGIQECQRSWSIDNVNCTSWANVIDLQSKYYNLFG